MAQNKKNENKVVGRAEVIITPRIDTATIGKALGDQFAKMDKPTLAFDGSMNEPDEFIYGKRFDPISGQDVWDYAISAKIPLETQLSGIAEDIQSLLDKRDELKSDLAEVEDTLRLRVQFMNAILSLNPFRQFFELAREVARLNKL